jgi:ribonuclease E
MTKRMLIDATHAEETRVVVLDGNRLEDFDVETAAKKQLKGNIYLAKVVRVEPSLQAAFVEYGGGRHGFLAFGEIHPDYYQIPVADRQRLLEMQEAEARAEEEADDAAAAADEAQNAAGQPHDFAERDSAEPGAAGDETPGDETPDDGAQDDGAPLGVHNEGAIPGHAAAEDEAPPPAHELAEPVDPPYGHQEAVIAAVEHEAETTAEAITEPPLPLEEPVQAAGEDTAIAQDFVAAREDALGTDLAPEATEPAAEDSEFEPQAFEAPPEAPNRDRDRAQREDEQREDDSREARAPARFMRSYKIQEVIRRRQILLVQVVKEERGSKGAALTTYISLAGRFSVLMPNSPRGGGISRKITSTADRRRLKEVTSELQIPRGMGLIVRTAGANRPKAEIKRDCEYLLELWDSIRETTMKSIAPALIHEEANLIKRAIRDNYSRDVDEVLVDGEAGWRAARDFMRMLMPAHARKVVLWNDPQPLFARQAVEAQLDAMLSPTVQLKSGGYLVINQTEALVAIDVNSGRSTRERGIEETALKTNLEAADEVARQLRLRDLAGLIVIDFIDMESRRNNAAVEKRMKDALKDDRARIQLGSISSFGLLEMSRQRLRPSLAETSFIPCPHCGGTGHVRSTETAALAVLRAIEEEGAKRRAAEILVHVAGAIALYVLNHKRTRIAEIEARYGMSVSFAADESLLPPDTRIDKLRAQVPGETPEPLYTPIPISTRPADVEDETVEEEEDETQEDAPAAATPATPIASETAEESEQQPKRRRRRRGGRRDDSGADAAEPKLPLEADAVLDPAIADQPDLPMPPVLTDEVPVLSAAGEEEARSRRRGRRGGRRRRRDESEPGSSPVATAESDGGPDGEEPASFDLPAYAGPTPADPFGGGVFDIYDVMEQAEARAAAPVSPPPPPIQAPPRPELEGEAAEATVPAEAAAIAPAEPAAPEPPMAETIVAAPEAAVAEAAVAVVQLEATVEPEPDIIVAVTAEPAAPPAPEPSAAPLEPVAQELPAEPEEPEEPTPAPLPNGHAAPAEPTAAPVSPPIIIDSSLPTAEKKRGWWRR